MIVYSSIIGDRDAPRDDVKCFTEYDKFIQDVYNAKIYKVLPHLFLDTDISIWIDGNIKLLVEPEKLVKEFLGNNDIALMSHFARHCIYQEAKECKAVAGDGNLPLQDLIQEQVDYYRDSGYPEHNGLYECNVLIRRHNKRIELFNNAWWAEICRHSNRDQISFPYVLAKFPDIKVNKIIGNVRNHKYFNYTSH